LSSAKDIKDQARSRSAKQGAKYKHFLASASTCGGGGCGWPSKRGDGGQFFFRMINAKPSHLARI
jgi:hypothetical protein